MSRRTTDTPPLDSAASLTPPPNPTIGRDALQATTTGTRRFIARIANRDEEFARHFPRKLTVSALGIGSYLGDCTDAEDELYRLSVHAAINSGVNVIDTASNYRCQRSERVVGQAIVEAIAAGEVRRDELVVCTKGGYVALDGEPPASREAYEQWLEKELFAPGILTPDDLVRGGHSIAPKFLAHQLAQSRANLGLDTIDVYYLHNPEEQLLMLDRQTFMAKMRAAFALLEERAERGEIAGYGCATWLGLRVPPDHKQHLTLAELMAIAREVGGTTHHFRAVQLPVSLAMPEAARLPTQPLGRKLVPLLEAADALGLGVVASAPLMQGRLSVGLPPAMTELFPACTSDAQRALRFASSLPGVATVLAGMRSVAHVQENLAAWS
ncbi:MAG: NADP-dependent oxidoreductase domain protein [Gemmatimonadetes bacterium]|nr:NADP-dependent oxidoreductase domain protein [Gemmatimonadota bacterium]